VPNMTTPQTIQEAIESTAKNPASVTVGSQTVTAQTIAAQIEADRYLAAKAAGAANASARGFGLRFARIKPPGGG
jgi:hypothetical protein